MRPSKRTKKSTIYEEAARLFRERGYQAASMRELAERVGLKVSSLYSHIGSKEELLYKICFDNAHHFVEGLETIESCEGTAVQQLHAVIGLHVDIAIKNPTSVTVFNDEWRHLTEDNLRDFLALRKTYESRLQAIIGRGIKEQTLKAVEPTVALYTLLTAIRWLHYWYKPSRNIQPAQLKQQLGTLLLDGLVQK